MSRAGSCFLLGLVFASSLPAAPADPFADLFGRTVHVYRQDIGTRRTGDGERGYRVLLQLPTISAEAWTAYRRTLQERIEGVFRIDGFSISSTKVTHLDENDTSIVVVVATQPTPLITQFAPSRRLHLVATRGASGATYVSYEVRTH